MLVILFGLSFTALTIYDVVGALKVCVDLGEVISRES